MKVIHLKTDSKIYVTKQLIRTFLEKDLDAFKASSRQFIRNNQVFNPQMPGLIA